MKYLKKILFILLFPYYIFGQETNIDYNTYNPSNCTNTFAFEQTINGIAHKSTRGGGY